jgi:hypothetical protein
MNVKSFIKISIFRRIRIGDGGGREESDHSESGSMKNKRISPYKKRPRAHLSLLKRDIFIKETFFPKSRIS